MPEMRAKANPKAAKDGKEAWTRWKSVVNLGDMGIRRMRLGPCGCASGLASTVQIYAVLGAALVLQGTVGLAGEPGETLPAPRPVSPPPVAAAPVYRLYTPPLSRDVWRVYDVDSKGFWRPRVAFTPQGDFYLYNGAPFYWADMYPQWFKSRVQGD
jgi:hypothetical protein